MWSHKAAVTLCRLTFDGQLDDVGGSGSNLILGDTSVTSLLLFSHVTKDEGVVRHEDVAASVLQVEYGLLKNSKRMKSVKIKHGNPVMEDQV